MTYRGRGTTILIAAIAAASLAGLSGMAGCSGGAGGDNGSGGGTSSGSDGGDRRGSRGRGGAGGPGTPGDGSGGSVASVPVEVAPAARRGISSFIETNGVLEAENEVDLVARVAAPVVALEVEEGDAVEKGQVLARLDEVDLRAQLEISRVELGESRVARERADLLKQNDLISPEEYEQIVSRHEMAGARYQASEILLDYTWIRAPFAGLIVRRYVNFAEHVAVNAPLFRLSNFQPLLCPIQIPERDLAKVRVGQSASLTVEPWPGERFLARVLRISPVVQATTGTVKVTLEVDGGARLRPGMFARVFIKVATHDDTLVIPKAALSLESIGETVYIVDGDVARRREVVIGFREGDHIEVIDGLTEGDPVIVVGQDGLSDGTPVRVLSEGATTGRAGSPAPSGPAGAPRGTGRPDYTTMPPEQLERAKEAMRSGGMSEEEIQRRIEAARPEPSESPAPPGAP